MTDANPTSNTNQPEPSFEQTLEAQIGRLNIRKQDSLNGVGIGELIGAILTAHNQATDQTVRRELENLAASGNWRVLLEDRIKQLKETK